MLVAGMSSSAPIDIIRSIPNTRTLDLMCEDYKNVMFFMDFNNMCKGLYYPDVIEAILNQIIINKIYPSIIIDEWMQLQNYLESWAKMSKRSIRCCYFAEAGQSYYHKNLYKGYKSGRQNAIFKLPDIVHMSDTEIKDRVEMIRIFIKNSWSWIEELAKRSNVLTMRLENLDADFIPELLLRQFDILEDDTVYVIFSGDGDMIQTIDFADNIKVFDGTTIITESNWLWSKKFFKFDGLKYPDVNPSCDKVILYKAVVGDSSDGIPGVKGVGNVRFYADILGAIPGDVRADDLPKMEHIFQQLADQKNKSAMKIVDNIETYRTCTKLVSFKVLIDYLRCDTNRYPSIKHRIDDNMQCLTESAKFLDVLKRKAV